MNKIQARGYIKSGPFRGQRVPQHIQNKIVRYYCEEHGFEYVLSRSEYSFANSTCHLEAALTDPYPIIVAYSLLQLPEDLASRKRFYKILRESKKELHFACENIIIHESNLLNELGQIEIILGCLTAIQDFKRVPPK